MDIGELKTVLKQRDETIIKQADEIAGLKDAHQTAVDSWMSALDRSAHNEKILDAEIAKLRTEHADTLKLYETVEAWVTTLDNGEIMDEPPWYCNLIIEIAFLKGGM